MNVLLVRPHATLPTSRWLQAMIRLEPYAQELVAAGVMPPHNVRICDLAVEERPIEAFRRELEAYRPDLVGFGGFSSQYGTNCELARICKAALPGVVTCLGGVHVSSAPAACHAPECFDYLVRGDGVSAIKILLEALAQGVPVPESAAMLATRSEQFARLAALPPPPLHLDGIHTRPRRDLVDASKYYCLSYGRPGEVLPTLFPETACVRTSVGCPNRCKFCVVHFLANGRYLQREVEDVVEEIAALPQRTIYFVDDETFINTERMTRIAERLLERGVEKRYISWARSDTICNHPELFALWKKAGLELVYVGFESLEEGNLAAYNKKATASQNRRARDILRQLDLNVHAAFMINPDFEAGDFLAVQRAVREMAPAEFAFTVYSPPPGTAEFEASRERFVCPDPFAFYDCLHTILPVRLPLKRFYRYLTILYGMGAARMPARVNGVRVPWRDRVRFLSEGVRFGWRLLRMYREYDRRYW